MVRITKRISLDDHEKDHIKAILVETLALEHLTLDERLSEIHDRLVLFAESLLSSVQDGCE